MLNIKKLDRASLLIGCSDSTMATDQENTTRAAIIKALEHYNIKGATITTGEGVWMGTLEKSINLQIINNFIDGASFNSLIESLYMYLLETLKQDEITIVIDSILCNL